MSLLIFGPCCKGCLSDFTILKVSDFVYVQLWTKQGCNAAYLMRPKAREMTHHGGLPDWLEESDPAR